MENQLKFHNYLDYMMVEYQKKEWFKNPNLNYFVSDVMNNLEIDDELEINNSLNRTFDACENLEISLLQNFKKIYSFDGASLKVDWKISSLAFYLIIINCNPINKIVAKAQLHFALSRF